MIIKPPVTELIDECVNKSIVNVKESKKNMKRAYVSLIYGRDPSISLFANAIAMANSLRRSKHRRVLLYTPDVPEHILTMFEDCGLFTELREVDYILANKALFKRDWFREVFTKFHVFNMTEFTKVMFLDLDTLVIDVHKMDALFDLDCNFAAMENSKRSSSASMWLDHGRSMETHCRLINAGVMLITPNADLFNILCKDVTSFSGHHVPGMTPEQFYLARVMGHHFKHISQIYNFEVQFHGGVPLTGIWRRTDDISDLVCLHFSGGSPLTTVSSKNYPPNDLGCQIEKFHVRKTWDTDIDRGVQLRANKRANQAFNLWKQNFLEAMKALDGAISEPNLTYSTLRLTRDDIANTI